VPDILCSRTHSIHALPPLTIPSETQQYREAGFMRLWSLSDPSSLSWSDTHPHTQGWAGMAGFRHKTRHKSKADQPPILQQFRDPLFRF